MTFPSPTIDSWVLITGASQGIGAAMAKDFAAYGYNVLLVARRTEVLEELAARLRAEHGVAAEAFPCDLSVPQEVDRLLEDLAGRRVSIAVNSAGVASFGPFLEQDDAYEATQFSLNAAAVFRITRAVLRPMVERGEGALCNVGSAAGNVPIPNNATYVFTKAGVNAFTEALHYELRGTGVHCTLLAPGPVREAHVPEAEQSIVDRVVPDALWTTYESCSRETIEAMVKNRRRVVPGPVSKAMNAISQAAPTAVLAPVMGWFYRKLGQD